MIYHTSPVEIKEIEKYHGVFDDVLFFSANVYKMSACKTLVYEVNEEELSFANTDELCEDFDSIAKIQRKLSRLIGVEMNEEELEELATDLLGGFKELNNVADDLGIECDDAMEFDWEIQAIQAQSAKKQGYDGCVSQDEQGSVYMIPMFGRKDLLNSSDRGWI